MLRQQEKMIDFKLFVGFVDADGIPNNCCPQTNAEKIGWAVALTLSARARADHLVCDVLSPEMVLDDIASILPAFGSSERHVFLGLTTAMEKIKFLLALGSEAPCSEDCEEGMTQREVWSGFFMYNKFRNMHKNFIYELSVSYIEDAMLHDCSVDFPLQ